MLKVAREVGEMHCFSDVFMLRLRAGRLKAKQETRANLQGGLGGKETRECCTDCPLLSVSHSYEKVWVRCLFYTLIIRKYSEDFQSLSAFFR